MIQPIHIRIHNFGLIKEASTNIPTNDFTFVSGEYHKDVDVASNAAGKSTFINALWWGLSGDAIQKKMKDFNASDIIGPFDTHAEVEVQLADPDHKYLIIRRRVRSGYQVSFHIDGELVSGKNATATEEMICEAFNVDWDVFRYSNYIPQEDAKTGFLYATDNERKKLIAKLYHKDFFDKALLRAKKLLKDRRADSYECVRSLDRIAGEITASEGNLRSVAEQVNNAKVSNLMAERAFKFDFADSLSKLDEDLNEVTEVITSKEQEEQDLSTAKDSLSEEYVKIKNVMDNLNAKDYALDVEVKGYLQSLAPLTETVRDMGDCPTCLRPIDERALKALGLERKRLIRKHNKADVLKTNGAERIKELGYDHQKKGNSIFKHQQAIEKLQQSLPPLRRQQTIYEGKIEKLKDKNLNLIDISPLEKLEKDIKDNLKKLHTSNFEVQIEKDDTDIIIKRLELWEHAYAHAMKSMAFESVIDRFTDLVNAKLIEIYSDDLSIKFDTKITKGDETKDKFTILIRDKDLRTWKGASMASGGQKRVISIAIALGMMELSTPRIGLFLCDEALEGVDTVAYKSVMSCIRGLAGTILNVSHVNPPAGERYITVVRKRGEISFGV